MSPRARIKERGNRSPLMGKFSTARCVCAPYSAPAGTRISPIVSRSMRYSTLRLYARFALYFTGFLVLWFLASEPRGDPRGARPAQSPARYTGVRHTRPRIVLSVANWLLFPVSNQGTKERRNKFGRRHRLPDDSVL